MRVSDAAVHVDRRRRHGEGAPVGSGIPAMKEQAIHHPSRGGRSAFADSAPGVLGGGRRVRPDALATPARCRPRNPNGRTCWVGAELDPDGTQVWCAGSRRPASARTLRRAYASALRRLNAWLAGRPLEDATHRRAPRRRWPRRASGPASRASPSPAEERTARDPRRLPRDRRSGQAQPFGAGGSRRAVLATCHRPAAAPRPRRRV